MLNKKFNFQKFENNLSTLEKTEQEGLDQKGLASVIRYVWNHYPTSYVDFDTFSYEDVLSAGSEMLCIPTDDVSEEEAAEAEAVFPITRNPWYQNMVIENVCGALHQTKNKIYEYEEDDFI
ncbi:hypothetical protein [Viridibacillus arvi]|uniref:hypothetical protein n=1 Tax=Viridibacillus arvi TaxID=263475 RepID=UPI0034CF56B6